MLYITCNDNSLPDRKFHCKYLAEQYCKWMQLGNKGCWWVEEEFESVEDMFDW